MNTWGIPSGTFLVIYIGVLLATTVLVLARRSRILGASTWKRLTSVELDPYDAAMLTGGGRLVLTTAICRLSEKGSLRPSANGRGLDASADLLPGADPVERWVHARARAGRSDPTSLLDTEAAEPVLAPIRARLWARGLLLEFHHARRLRRQAAWFVPAEALGVARVIAGLHNHRPVGFLIVLMVVAAFAAYALTDPPLVTSAGRRKLDALKGNPAAFGSYGVAGDVALAGVASLWAADAMLATTLGLKRPGAGGWSGGGGGCGGGGCGGGCGG